MKELLEAGVHFGHQVRRWNPKMKEYIFGERNGIYIIDLQKTQKLFRDALNYVTAAITETAEYNGSCLSAQNAKRKTLSKKKPNVADNIISTIVGWAVSMTNFQTVQNSIKKMREIEAMKEDGRFEMLTKKERLRNRQRIRRFDEKSWGYQRI